METVRKNKIFLIDTLSNDASIVLQYVQNDNIIIQRDYKKLNQQNHTDEKIITNLLDTLMGKGDETCQKFVKVLEREDFQEIFPQLKNLFTPEQPSHKTSDEPKDPAKASDKVGEYKMSSNPRGFCLIINNMDFGGTMAYRRGSDQDEESLKKVFTWLGFTVDVHRNKTAEEMKTILKFYAQKHHEGDCFVCCLLSHGDTGGVCGTDGCLVAGSDIYGLFDGTSCPSLINKPKVFFIQACRGRKQDRGVKVQADDHKAEKAGEEEEEEEEEEDFENDAVQITIPAEADFLVARSTVKWYASFRNASGSWFIQSLCEQLNKFSQTEDVYSILLRVNEEVSAKIGKCRVKQMPVQKFTLRKKLVFRVPQ